MKRRIGAALLTLLVVLSCPTQADARRIPKPPPPPKNGPAWMVFAHECRHINKLSSALECRPEGLFGKMELHWRVKPSSLSPERREELLYQFNRIGLRYIGFGFRGFNVTADFYPEKRFDSCSDWYYGSGHNFVCSKYKIDERGAGVPVRKNHDAAPKTPDSSAKSTGP